MVIMGYSMTTELAVIEQKDIVSVFTNENGVDVLFDRLASEVRAEVPDLTTKKGRDRIASLAYKVSKSKGVVDEYGKELVAAEKARLALIDADRKKWRDKCDSLRDEIRKPLTDWENKEAARVAKHQLNISNMIALADAAKESTALGIKSLIDELSNTELGEQWEEFAAQAGKAKDDTMRSLQASLIIQQKHEDEQAELARLREEAARRAQEDRDRQIAEQAAEKARLEAEAKAAKEKANIEAKAKAERDAAEKARVDAEREQARLLAEADAAKLREADAERRRVEQEAQAKQQAELAKQQAEERQKQAIEADRKRIAAEQLAQQQEAERIEAERFKNVEHRRAINKEVLASIVGMGIDDEKAKSLITAIAKGLIKNLSINY
jgi:colicin import membrane protein